jgi:glutaredoxin 2
MEKEWLEELSSTLSQDLVHERWKNQELENMLTSQITTAAEVKKEEQHSLTQLNGLNEQIGGWCTVIQDLQARVLKLQEALSFCEESFHSQLTDMSKVFSIIQILNS